MSNNAWPGLQQFHLPFTSPVLVFFTVLLVILLIPIVLSRIRVPDIVGFIIAGVIIGPYGLNLLGKNPAIELFATIGLLYIMFLAGIELNIDRFKKTRHKSLVFGLLTFSLPILIGFPVCRYLLGYALLPSILTASMFATHTLVAYPIISKYKLAENEAVGVTVGGTILTDTAVLLILAIIIGAKQGGLTSVFWLRLMISMAVFLAVVFFVVPRIAKWLLGIGGQSKTAQYICMMACMFFSALLAQVAGIEPIVGAFMAALALNRLIPKPSKLFNDIQFVGNAIFIPFFLVSVGMIVNLQVLFHGPAALLVAATLTIVALAGKWLSAFFTQQLYRYSHTQRQLVFGLSSSHAAATLAMILIGYKNGIIDANLLNGTIVLILVTCMVASFATERAARKLVTAPKEQMVE